MFSAIGDVEQQARRACGPPARGRCRGRWRRAAWRSAIGSPSSADRAAEQRVDAEDGAGELGAAGADQAGEAEDLAAAEREVDGCGRDRPAVAQLDDLQRRRRRAARLGGM